MGFLCGFRVTNLSVPLMPVKYIFVQYLIVFQAVETLAETQLIALSPYNQLLPFKIPLF